MEKEGREGGKRETKITKEDRGKERRRMEKRQKIEMEIGSEEKGNHGDE